MEAKAGRQAAPTGQVALNDEKALLRDGFKDILQELMEAELDATLGYEKKPEIREWQSRPLNPVYPFVFMDWYKEVISAVSPQVQHCVVYMLRNSFKYVDYSDLKKFSSDFKSVCNAPNEKAGLDALTDIREKWGRKLQRA